MSKKNHIILLITKVVFIILCFGIAFCTSSFSQAFSARAKIDKNDVLSSVTAATSSGNPVETSYSNGKIVLKLSNVSDSENVNLSVKIPTDKEIDLSNLKNSFKSGEKRDQFLELYQAGPWKSNLYCKFSGASSVKYLLKYNGNEQNINGSSTFVSDELIVSRETMSINLSFGTATNMTIKNGKYYLDFYYKLNGLSYETTNNPDPNYAMIILHSVGTVFTSFFKASSYQQLGTGTFWLTFIGVIYMFGACYYLFKDIKNSFRIGRIVKHNGAKEGVPAIRQTFVNGACVKSEKTTIGGSSGVFAGIVAFILSYFILLALLPIRLLIYIGKDIYYIATEKTDEYCELVSVAGNIIGSVGLFAIAYGFMLLIMGGTGAIIGILVFGSGIALFVFANKLCKDKEKKYKLFEIEDD